MRLLEPDVWELAAVASVPAHRSSPELARVVDEEEDELEGVRDADEVELGRRRVRDLTLPVSSARRRRP